MYGGGHMSDKNHHMWELVNLNHVLEQMRQQALMLKEEGPRVFVTGSVNSGKSSICKILINYALKLGWKPLLADIDLS